MVSRICLCQTLFAFLVTSHMLLNNTVGDDYYANWQWTARSSDRLTAKPKSRGLCKENNHKLILKLYCDSGRDRLDTNE
ncbi:hypothetical protein T12_6922 [Trichinella patagoniensis]|uniref:Secreted protein n=1 Tax=Trichinella patagoniensis TaxID=990121 RepID=A0A0V0Z712_9BILA|nr:hypothetical protein T12_6922 [Trichinella patagoniensis]